MHAMMQERCQQIITFDVSLNIQGMQKNEADALQRKKLDITFYLFILGKNHHCFMLSQA